MYALLAAAMLVVLALGIGIGAAVAAARNATTVRTVTIATHTSPAVTVPSSVSSLQQSVEDVVNAVRPSVVEITAIGSQQEAIGSGNILTANGYIVTNDHVVRGFNSFTVTLSNGTSQPAQVVGEDAQDDLAVIKIAATNLQPISIGDSAKAQVGEFAIAIGNPLGLRQTPTFGIVSALNRSVSEAPDGPAGQLTGLIQTSAPINPGNSGGALVDLSGQLIGIPTLGAVNPSTGTAASGIGYAIPSNRVQYVATQLMQHGQITSTGQGFIGIRATNVDPQVAAANNLSVQSGVLVTGFANDAAGQSPAQQAGLQVGDVITAVSGQSTMGNDDLAAALVSQSPGTQVTLTVVRGTSQLTIKVTLGERPANAQG
jgi:S1-C subfamily serine protease